MKRYSHNSWSERVGSPLTLHCAALAAVAVLNIWLLLWLFVDWRETGATSVLAHKKIELAALNLEAVPLRGLDRRLIETRQQIETFYAQRIPASYSSIATRIGELEVQSGVRQSRILYSQGPPGENLTEIEIDAGISGEYPQIMRFVNELERDPSFFVIRAMVLTGQDGGQVSLRLRVSTWVRPADALASGLPSAQKLSPAILRSSPSGKGGE